MLYGPCIICVQFMSNFFLSSLHNIFKTCLSMVSSFCFCVVFVLLLLHLSVCFESLCLIPHLTVAITNLCIHGISVLVCVHAHVHVYVLT
jgi:lipopolysaccharide export LptBFGC system permease protein LptF